MKKILFTIYILLIATCSYASPERIVSLSPAITEIVYAFGAEDSLIGVSNYCDYPPQAQEKEKVGGFINPNIEKILSLGPDLVILSPNSGTKYVQKQLEKLAINTMVVSFYTLDDLLKAYAQIGKILERENIAHMEQEKIIKTRERIQTSIPPHYKPTVLFVRSHNPLYVAARGTYENDLIDAIGGCNAVSGETKERYPKYSIEEIMRINPDVIIDATFYETPLAAEKKMMARFWSDLRSIRAVEERKVYIIKTDIHSVPGPRTAQMLLIMAKLVYPDIFGEETEYTERLL